MSEKSKKAKKPKSESLADAAARDAATAAKGPRSATINRSFLSRKAFEDFLETLSDDEQKTARSYFRKSLDAHLRAAGVMVFDAR